MSATSSIPALKALALLKVMLAFNLISVCAPVNAAVERSMQIGSEGDVPLMSFSLRPKSGVVYDVKLLTDVASDLDRVGRATSAIQGINIHVRVLLDGKVIGDCFSKNLRWFSGKEDSGFYTCSMAAFKLDRAQHVQWHGVVPPWELPLLVAGLDYTIEVKILGNVQAFLAEFGETEVVVSQSVAQK